MCCYSRRSERSGNSSWRPHFSKLKTVVYTQQVGGGVGMGWEGGGGMGCLSI